MIDKIDYKIEILLKHRDAPSVIKSPELRASVCTLIEKAYFLEAVILSNRTFSEGIDNQFFTAKAAINRHFRDWGLDEVADIYNEVCEIAEPYLI
jgi:hypothetical protein